MNAAQWQLGRESDNQMKLSHSCNMNLSVWGFTQSLRFTLPERDGDRKRWLSARYHKSTHTQTDRHTLASFCLSSRYRAKHKTCPYLHGYLIGLWLRVRVNGESCYLYTSQFGFRAPNSYSRTTALHLMQCCGRSHDGFTLRDSVPAF